MTETCLPSARPAWVSRLPARNASAASSRRFTWAAKDLVDFGVVDVAGALAGDRVIRRAQWT